jgi:TPR repeat protein
MKFKPFATVLLASLSVVSLCRAELKVSERLRCGQYQEILADTKQPHDGEWAFARFFLVPDKAAYEAAFKAHESGDLLGKFIVMRCHRDGAGVKQDMNVVDKMDRELQKELAKKENAGPAAFYMRSYLSQETEKDFDTEGKTINPEETLKARGDASRNHLFAAAEGGFAQAMCEAGGLLQKQEPDKAMGWYRKAADLGLAEAMKDVGYLLSDPRRGSPLDVPGAIQWTRKAANLGDVDAMFNMVVFHERFRFPGVTREEAVSWIDKAAAGGHPIGFLEKGLALVQGAHGYTTNKETGMALLQKAAGTGYPYVLGKLAHCYGNGAGLTRNLRKAAEFGKAAWSQGNFDAAEIISGAYREDKELAAKTAEAAYWQGFASRPAPQAAVELDEKNPNIVKEIAKIDPFALKIE